LGWFVYVFHLLITSQFELKCTAGSELFYLLSTGWETEGSGVEGLGHCLAKNSVWLTTEPFIFTLKCRLQIKSFPSFTP